jgi:sialic acid synthase SpsE
MHTYEEIKVAVAYLKQFTSDIILFQATTMYPCPDELVNLNVLKTYRTDLNVLVGYSSHDNGFIMPAASVAAGACTIEKHFTLDKKMIGPDHSASADSTEMAMIVQYAKQVFKGMGDGLKILNEEEKEARLKYGVSIVSAATIQKGDILTEELLTVKCPGGGISPVLFDSLIGKRATSVIEKDETINIQDVE